MIHEKGKNIGDEKFFAGTRSHTVSHIHMSQIAEELTFAVLSVTKFENSRCFWDFLELSQEANFAPFLSSWPSTATTMSFGHRGYPKNSKKWPTFGTILNFL